MRGRRAREQRCRWSRPSCATSRPPRPPLQHRLRDERLGELRAISRPLDDLNDQLRRISAQLVALEQRVGDLERPAVDLAADDADRRAARSLVDEVRLEHDRTQAGLAAIAFYEERIARLERAARWMRTSMDLWCGVIGGASVRT